MGGNKLNLKDAGIYDLVNIFKGEATDAHSMSQGGIINSTSRIINIPAYQRPYRWGENNINRLFQDYRENNSEYFLGSAVVVEKAKDQSIEFDVVDGQQRITTLFLLNYIRFLLKRRFVSEKLRNPFQSKASEYCNQLKNCYVNLIGKNTLPFDNILRKIEEQSEDESLGAEERVNQLIECYKKNLCIPEVKNTSQETAEERIKKAREFFKYEQLCLKYTRSRYDSVLRDALCNVYLKNSLDTTDYELDTIIKDDLNKDEFSSNYLKAMKTIFSNIWSEAKRRVKDETNATLQEKCEEAIRFSDEIIKNMSLCIVLTENENDANKLFEVLNDRALEVEDLELIKNHFYKEYCTKSDDDDITKDAHIAELDEIWADKIFSGNTENRTRLISYLAAVYLTCDKELAFKDDAKLKDAIEKNYATKYYPHGGTKYEYENILADFNTYYAIKIMMEKFDIKAQKLNEISLEAEQTNKSITYKAVHLLNALKYHAVIPALTNVIIAVYCKNHSLTDANFEKDFNKFVSELIDDSKHTNPKFEKIHKCAFMLWTAALKGKDYTIPRDIAKRIIEKNGYVGCSTDAMDFLGSEVSNLDTELDVWLTDWTYSSSKSFAVKVIMLHLLLSDRTVITGSKGYDADSVELELDTALAYKLEAGRLQLDHLEADTPSGNPDDYYLSLDMEKRRKDVNSYLGNFMILDASDNNKKNNVPLYRAMSYYSRIEKSWLVEDIKAMMSDSKYFELESNIPKEEFFKERSKRLKHYFKALLDRKLKDTKVTVNF